MSRTGRALLAAGLAFLAAACSGPGAFPSLSSTSLPQNATTSTTAPATTAVTGTIAPGPFHPPEIDHTWRMESRLERSYSGPGLADLLESTETEEVHLSNDLWSRSRVWRSSGNESAEDAVRVGEDLWRRGLHRSWLRLPGIGVDDTGHPLLWDSAADPFYGALAGLECRPETRNGYDTCRFALTDAQAIPIIDPFEDINLTLLPSRLYTAAVEVWVERATGRLVAVEGDYTGNAASFLQMPTALPEETVVRVMMTVDYSAFDDPSLQVEAPPAEEGPEGLPAWYSVYRDPDLRFRAALPYAWAIERRSAFPGAATVSLTSWDLSTGMAAVRVPTAEFPGIADDGVAGWLVATGLHSQEKPAVPLEAAGATTRFILEDGGEAWSQAFHLEDPDMPRDVVGVVAADGVDTLVFYLFAEDGSFLPLEEARDTLLATLALLPAGGGIEA